MSSSGSSPSSSAASASPDCATGGRRMGSNTKYVAPAASRMPSSSWISSVGRSAGQALELPTQSLELGGGGVRRCWHYRRHWSDCAGFAGPTTQGERQNCAPDSDEDRRLEGDREVEATLGGGH